MTEWYREKKGRGENNQIIVLMKSKAKPQLTLKAIIQEQHSHNLLLHTNMNTGARLLPFPISSVITVYMYMYIYNNSYIKHL